MKPALVTFMVLAAANTTFAVAQEGSSGPPKAPIIVIPSPLPAPAPASPSVPVPRLSELEQR